MFIALFVGWKMGLVKVMREMASCGGLRRKRWALNVFLFLVRFLAPIAIFIIFLKGIKVLDLLVNLF